MNLLRAMTENLDPKAYQPSDSERKVLSLVVHSDTPQMAYGQASGKDVVTSRDKLIKLGFLSYDDGGLTLTATGNELVQSQAIENNPTLDD